METYTELKLRVIPFSRLFFFLFSLSHMNRIQNDGKDEDEDEDEDEDKDEDEDEDEIIIRDR